MGKELYVPLSKEYEVIGVPKRVVIRSTKQEDVEKGSSTWFPMQISLINPVHVGPKH